MRKPFLIFMLGLLSLIRVADAQCLQLDKVTPSATNRGQEFFFGNDADISGRYAIIGAPNDGADTNGGIAGSGPGAAYIFKQNAVGHWDELQKLQAPFPQIGSNFGWTVAIDSIYAVVGAYWDITNAQNNDTIIDAGAVYVFRNDGNDNWLFMQKLVASDRGVSDQFGTSVDIDGLFIAAGAPKDEQDAGGSNTLPTAGSAYLFEFNGTAWTQVQKIIPSDRNAYDEFGTAISISGNFLAVGTPLADKDAAGMNTMNAAGAVYIFERNGTGVWIQDQKLAAADRSPNDWLGVSVALDNNMLVAGAQYQDSDENGLFPRPDAGAAYVYRRDGVGTWVQVQKLVSADRDTADLFGFGVSISGDYILCGARTEKEDTTNANTLYDAGSAYLFQRNMANVWLPYCKIVPDDRGPDDYFGNSVTIDKKNILITAPYDDEDTAGLNPLYYAGSSYFFHIGPPEIITTSTSPAVNPTAFTVHYIAASGTGWINIPEPGEVEMLNANGQRLWMSHLENTTWVNLPSVAPGMYIFCYHSKGITSAAKLVITGIPE